MLSILTSANFQLLLARSLLGYNASRSKMPDTIRESLFTPAVTVVQLRD